MVAEGTTGEALAARLRADGHHVDTTQSGQDALGRARARQYLIYFLSFELGGMDGVELMKEIRRVQPEASIIVTWRGPGTCEDEFVALAQRAVSGQADDTATNVLGRYGEAAHQRNSRANRTQYHGVGRHSRHRPLHSLREDEEVRYTEGVTQWRPDKNGLRPANYPKVLTNLPLVV